MWCDGAGVAIFDKLHSRAYDDEVILYAFDLLELDSEDWRVRPLDLTSARRSSPRSSPRPRATAQPSLPKTKNPTAPGMLRFKDAEP